MNFHHIETSQLICSANQLTGFRNMMENIGREWDMSTGIKNIERMEIINIRNHRRSCLESY